MQYSAEIDRIAYEHAADGLPVKEIARQMGITTATVRRMLRREVARQREAEETPRE